MNKVFIFLFTIVVISCTDTQEYDRQTAILKQQLATYNKMWQETIPAEYADSLVKYSCSCGAGQSLQAAYDYFDGEDTEEIETIEQYVRECKKPHPPNMVQRYTELVAERDNRIKYYRLLAEDVLNTLKNR